MAARDEPQRPAGNAADPGAGRPIRDLDTSRPHIARVYNFWLGGKDNFRADREAASNYIRDFPDVVPGVRMQRRFLRLAVTFLAADQRIRQFLDIGTGIPAANNTHEVAQAVAPDCRIVYVDNDPVVLTHARALLTSQPGGVTAYLDADLRDTDRVLEQAAATLDFTQPVAIMLIGILQLIPDADHPGQIVAELLRAVPSGSWLAIAQPASDVQPRQMALATRNLNEHVSSPVTLRSHDQVEAFFSGTDLTPPGLVQMHRWLRHWDPDPAGLPDISDETAAYCGLGHKP